MRFRGRLREYRIVGARAPSKVKKGVDNTPYKMHIFATNSVSAKSRFWYYVKKMQKIKKTNGCILECAELAQKSPHVVKNFGVWLRYDSRSGTHNMYREYRDLTKVGAITSCYRDMAARHRARVHDIHIIRIEQIPASKCRRDNVKRFHDSKIKFPLPQRVPPRSKSLFMAHRPNMFM
eukprot:TRINITY_DN10645_c0_g1_i1.p1 TRINITY_DN10645_c0_g1~~TRINITY_DN10645_c0_g1_i1.p1  ORF type:complete len:178 (-),score=21.95 TRINITY_DN10645_c0_g1_i1:60-593(-)